jgi:thiamine pyrophosphate-dependent acetolactate synthase large subunit-like protein
MKSEGQGMINRLQATRYLVQQLTNEPIIASLGNPKFDLFTAQDRPQNFYMWNSMGMASSMGLGLAIARPDLKVIILDGDGALLMNLNSLPTAAARVPVNLIHIIWDNRQFELTGGQPTHTAFHTNLEAMARGAGFTQVEQVETQEAFERAFPRALQEPGPWILVALIDAERATGRPPKSPTYIKHRFMQSLGVTPV